jgi:Transposase DDE domain
VLIDGDGRPVCSEMWPGNTADVTALVPLIDRLRRRFSIGRVCIVADRGMISVETIAALEARGLLYILGVRERTDNLVRDVVLNDTASFVPLVIEKLANGQQRCREAAASWSCSTQCVARTMRDGLRAPAHARAANRMPKLRRRL